MKNNKKTGLSVLRLTGNSLVSPSLIGRVNSGIVLPSRVPILFVGISVRGLEIGTCIVISSLPLVASEVSPGGLLTLLGSDTGEFIHPSNGMAITIARPIKLDLILFMSNHVIQPIY